jgi:hypothetical protein
MALPQSAVSDLLEVLRAGQAVDLIRESVHTVLQELIEAEAAEAIGAIRYERTETSDPPSSRARGGRVFAETYGYGHQTFTHVDAVAGRLPLTAVSATDLVW